MFSIIHFIIRNQANVKSQSNTERRGKGKTKPSVQGMGDKEDEEDMELAMMDIQDITMVDHNNRSAPQSENNNNNNTRNLLDSQTLQNSNGALLDSLKGKDYNPHLSQTASDSTVTVLPRIPVPERATVNDCDRNASHTCSGNFKKGLSHGESDSYKKKSGRLLSLRVHSQNEEEDNASPVVPNMDTSKVSYHP